MSLSEQERELRALLDAATDLPWEEGDATPAERIDGLLVGPSQDIEPMIAAGCDPDDAALIVAAVNALPGLLDALADAQQRLDAVRAAVVKAQEMDKRGPDQFKTGQEHLPPAFREVNWKSAFMALAAIVTEIDAALDAAPSAPAEPHRVRDDDPRNPHGGTNPDCTGTLCPACGCCCHCADDCRCPGERGCAAQDCGCAA